MDKQSKASDIIILPRSETIPVDEAHKKTHVLAKVQEQLLAMSKHLPDNLDMTELSTSSFYFSRTKRLIDFHLDFHLGLVPFFSQEVVTVALLYSTDDKSPYGVNFRGGWELSFSFFSDEPMRTAFAQFAELHPKEASFAATMYLFDEAGNFAKVIRVHKNLAVERQPILDLKFAKDYFSKITRLDFYFAERAFTVMKERLEEYRG